MLDSAEELIAHIVVVGKVRDTLVIFEDIRSNIDEKSASRHRIVISSNFFDDDHCLYSCSNFSVFFYTNNNKHVSFPYLYPSFFAFCIVTAAPEKRFRQFIAVRFSMSGCTLSLLKLFNRYTKTPHIIKSFFFSSLKKS